MKTLFIAAAVCLVLWLLYTFNPLTAGFYPRCPSKLITGCDCPGCGTLRALHALTHGHIAEAWNYNAALFFGIPLAIICIAADHGRGPAKLRRVVLAPAFALLMLVLLIVWTIFRNIP